MIGPIPLDKTTTVPFRFVLIEIPSNKKQTLTKMPFIFSPFSQSDNVAHNGLGNCHKPSPSDSRDGAEYGQLNRSLG